MSQPIAEASVRLRADSSGFKGDADRQIRGALDSIATGVGRSMTVAGGLAGAAFTVAAVRGIQINSQLEVAEAQFETLLGSADRAQERVESLFEFAKNTPFETGPIIQASRQLQNFGGDALASEQRLTLVGDAAAGASAPIEELAFWVGRAYAAIQAGQPFGEAAMRLTELAVLTPQTRQKMEELQETGASASEIFQLLEGDLGRFGGAMEKQADLGVGVQSTLSDIANLSAGRVFSPLYEDAKQLGRALIGLADTPWAEAVISETQQMVGMSGSLIDRLIGRIMRLGATDPGAVIDRFDSLRRIIEDTSGALDDVPPGAALAGGALAAVATRAIPGLGLVSPILSAIVGGVLGVVSTSEEGRDALEGLGDAAGDAASTVGPELGAAIAEVVPPLADLVTSGLELATDVLPVISETAADAASIVGPVLGGALELVAGAIGLVTGEGDSALPVIAGLGAALLFDRAGPGVSVLGFVGDKIRDVNEAARITAQNGGGLSDFVGLLGGGAGGLGAAAAGAVAVGLLTSAFVAQRQQVADARAQVTAYRDAIEETGSTLDGAAQVLGEWLAAADGRDSESIDLLAGSLDRLGFTTRDLADAFDAGGDASVQFQDSVIAGARDILAAEQGYASYQEILDKIAATDIDSPALGRLQEDQAQVDQAARQLNDTLDVQFDRFSEGREAQRLYGDLSRDSATATEQLTVAIDGLTAAQDRNAGRAKQLDDAQLAATEATRRFQEALADGAGGFDINTEAGARNYRALRDQVRTQAELAEAQVRAGGSTDDATARLVLQAGALANLKDQGQITTEQYESLLTQFGLTPEAIQTTVTAAGVEETRSDLEDLKKRLGAIDDTKVQSEVQALLDDAGTNPGKLAAVKARIDAYFAANPVRVASRLAEPTQTRPTISGGVRRFAEGGLVRAFADGGTTEQHVAQIAPAGAWRVWAEPETGGEAYIPLAPTKRERSLSIWRETGRLLGAERFADGGIKASPADLEKWNTAVAKFQAEQAAQLAKWNAAVARFQVEQAEEARRAQEAADEFNRRKFSNAVEWRFERSSPQEQADMARGVLANTEPWTDEWVRWARRLEDATTAIESAAEESATQISRNRIEWQAEQLEGEQLVAFLVAQRNQFAEYTDEWMRWARQVRQAEETLARDREASAKTAAEQERRTSDRRDAQRVYQLNLTGQFGPVDEVEEQFRRMEILDGLAVS